MVIGFQCWDTLSTQHPTYRFAWGQNKDEGEKNDSAHKYIVCIALDLFYEFLYCCEKKKGCEMELGPNFTLLREYNLQLDQHMVQMIHGNCSSPYETISNV